MYMLSSLDSDSLGVLLVLSGRQGAGGFNVTCNVVKEERCCLNG